MDAERKAERYQITAYENLLLVANALGLSDNAAQQPQANLNWRTSAVISAPEYLPTASIFNGSGSKVSRNAPISPAPR